MVLFYQVAMEKKTRESRHLTGRSNKIPKLEIYKKHLGGGFNCFSPPFGDDRPAVC